MKPDDMRGITLVAHPSMVGALLQFVDEYSDVLGRYKLSIQAELEEDFMEIFGDDFEAAALLDYGSLGGEQQLSTEVIVGAVGCIIYFSDPLSVLSYHSDTEAVERLINVTNILFASNPTTAVALMEVLSEGVRGKPELMPSMFAKLESPAVAEYAAQQKALVNQMKVRAGGGGGEPTPLSTPRLKGYGSSTDLVGIDERKLGSHHLKDAVHAVQLLKHVEFKLHQSGRAMLHGAPPLDNPMASNPGPCSYLTNPKDMRCLALISHNHMKPAMQDFVVQNKEVLRKFRLTGTNSTMTMLRSVLGDDANFGPACASGPLGGDAQVGAQLCLSNIGGVIFFTDPLSAHPHLADVLALVRLVNVKNVLHATNTATATAMVQVLGKAMAGHPELIPSFFQDLASPAICACHDNEDDKDFISALKAREDSPGGRRTAVDAFEKMPAIQEISRRGSLARRSSSNPDPEAEQESFKSVIKSEAEPESFKSNRSLSPTGQGAAAGEMDGTAKMLLIGAAALMGTTMMLAVGGLATVGVLLLRKK